MNATPSTSLRRLLALVALSAALFACGSEAAPASDAGSALDLTIDEAGETTDTTSDAGADPEGTSTGGDVDSSDGTDASDEQDAADGTTDDDTPVTAALTGGQLAPEGARSLWSGTIDGRIGISMWLTQEDDLVRGELTYNTVGEPIAIHGQAYPSGDAWLLREFADDGQVTGTLILGVVADGVVSDATWGDFDLDLSLDGVDDTATSFDPLVRAGQYDYAFAPFPGDDTCCGATGQLRITDVTADELTIEIENTTGAPAYNLAIIDPITVPLDGNVARYEQLGDGVDCAFDLRIYDGVVHVDHVDDRFDCLFGNAAGVEGTYVLTQPFVSADDSPFTDAVLTSNEFGGVQLGMTWSELSEEFGAPAYDPETADQISEGCNYVRIPSDPQSPWFMLLGDGDEAVVSRIELVDEGQATDAGIRLGSTVSDIRAAYAEVTTAPHVYLGEGAEYVTVADNDDPDSTVLFETDEAGVVIAVRNGFDDPIRWIEGCA